MTKAWGYPYLKMSLPSFFLGFRRPNLTAGWKYLFVCFLFHPPPEPNIITRSTQSIMYVPLQVNRYWKKYFTYPSVQIFKVMLRRFSFSRIWSSTQDHSVLVLLLNLVGFFITSWPRWSNRNILYHSCTRLKGVSRGGQPLNVFTWFIGAGGRSATNGRVTTFEYCQVVFFQLLRLLSTHILV